MIAAIYARKSTDQTGVSDEQRSVARQVEHARAYAARKGWTVADAHIYVDDGISGAEFTNRPGFLRLMNALKPRALFQVLVMSEESRLGREAIETAYALKQLVQAGVRVFFYLEDRERTLDSPTDKIMLSLTAFADELEREKARQRTADAMLRKARARHVTGGRVFGYDNVEVTAPDATGASRRLYVERRINQTEAAVIRRIFELCARGVGKARIAKQLNAEGAARPRSPQGRPSGWAPSTVHAVLYRELYRGRIVWNRTRKRDRWGQKRCQKRAESEWVIVEAPELRIVPQALWDAAHGRLADSRKIYLRGTDGQLWGRPPSGVEAKYLLTGMASCWKCGGTLEVRSRAHGSRRGFFYTCSTYRRRGVAVCDNQAWIPMRAADEAVLEAIESDVLQPAIVEAAVARALQMLTAPQEVEQRRVHLERALASVQGELARLTSAIAAGGDLPALIAALKARDAERDRLTLDLAAIARRASAPQLDRAQLTAKLRERLEDWRGLVRRHVPQARQILRKLLRGRLVFTPEVRGSCEGYRFTGEGALDRFLSGFLLDAQAVASPTGFEPVFQP